MSGMIPSRPPTTEGADHDGTASAGAPEVAQTVAWDRAEAGLVGRHNFMERYSVTHVARPDAGRTLCGAKILWMFFSPGDSRRCDRCFALAAKRGYVDEYGDPFDAR